MVRRLKAEHTLAFAGSGAVGDSCLVKVPAMEVQHD